MINHSDPFTLNHVKKLLDILSFTEEICNPSMHVLKFVGTILKVLQRLLQYFLKMSDNFRYQLKG